MHYVRALRFEDRPDYQGIRQVFKKLLIKEGHEYDHLYDWVMINQSHMQENIFSVESFDDIVLKTDRGARTLKTNESGEGLKSGNENDEEEEVKQEVDIDEEDD